MPFDRSRRILQPEALDTEPAHVVAGAMADLVRVNRWLGGHTILPGLFRQFVAREDAFTVLDAGAGSGDIGQILRSHYPSALVTSLDRRPEYLRPASPPRVAADAFRLPFRERSFDFVTCSLFLHHFSNEQIVELMASFRSIARRAVIVVDLQRHWLAYRFMPATRWLFRWHELCVRDGMISVQAGFDPGELQSLARAAGAPGAAVRRCRPWFRLSLVVPA